MQYVTELNLGNMTHELINFMQQSIEALKSELDKSTKTVEEQKLIIDELKETITIQASHIFELNSDVNELNTKIDRLLCK